MSEKEKESFRLAFAFYDKWRSEIIETDAQWEQFAKDVGKLAADMDTDHNILARNLFYAVIDSISELYKNGMKPVPAGYFGRDDL